MMHSLKIATKVASARLMTATFATGALCATFLVGQQALQLVRSFEPVSNWFEPYEIQVPTPQSADAESPSETDNAKPYLFYGRFIRKPFEATYSVSVVRIDYGDLVVCDHSEVHFYWPRSLTNLRVWTIDEFVGEHCHLDPGTYRMEVSWNLNRDGYWPVRLQMKSNMFEIIARDRSRP